jgi:hypothetical protein
MENIPLTPTGTDLHIEGYPNAVKVIELEDQKSRNLADLTLHKNDLENALNYLLLLEQPSSESDLNPVIREALWISAIIQFSKCFGRSNARVRLDKSVVYEGESTEALQAFEFFKCLRDKHVAHDENSYSQCLTGAILNAQDSPHKIAKIICLEMRAVTLEQANYSNLKLLIKKASEWVTHQFDSLCQEITDELERETYQALFTRNDVRVDPPLIEDIGKNRGRKASS